jgi:hypothetical protein
MITTLLAPPVVAASATGGVAISHPNARCGA